MLLDKVKQRLRIYFTGLLGTIFNDKIAIETSFNQKKWFFIKNLANWSFIDVCNELRSY